MHSRPSLILLGGFGFVGRNMLDQLANGPAIDTFDPVVVDDLSMAVAGHEDLGITHHIGAYDAPASLEFVNAIEGQRVFVLLAGETRVAESRERPLDFIAANVEAPARFVTQALRPGDGFILVSTAGALFDGTAPLTLETAYSPKNFYGATKAAEEMLLEKLVEMQGGRFSIVRLTNVYGAFSDRKKSAIHAFSRAVHSGTEVTINGDGLQSRDFVYAGDVGRGIIELARQVSAGTAEPVNMIGSGASENLLDVVRTIETAAGRPLARKHLPAKELLATEPRDVIVDPIQGRALLGGKPTSFADGIAATVAYYGPALAPA